MMISKSIACCALLLFSLLIFATAASADQPPPATFGIAAGGDGVASVRSGPGTRFPVVMSIQNGTRFHLMGYITAQQAGTTQGWWQVQTQNGQAAFISDVVVNVEGWYRTPRDYWHIQIASYSSYQQAAMHLQQWRVPAGHIFLAASGWYAVTYSDPIPGKWQAEALKNQLKAMGAIPQDSFVTSGNRLAQQICCVYDAAGNGWNPQAPNWNSYNGGQMGLQ